MAHPAVERRRVGFRLLDRSRVAAAVVTVTAVIGVVAVARPLVDVEGAIRRHDWPAALARLDRRERWLPAAHAFQRARILRRQDRLAEAAAALGAAGDEAAAARERAEARRLAERHRRLTELTRRAIGEPRNADLLVEIASILLDLGLTDDGARWLETAVELDPQHATARRMLDDMKREGQLHGAGGDDDDIATIHGRNDA